MESNTVIYQVDSFSKVAYEGNPAGVMILSEEMSVSEMQNIAMEMNLSETAFVYQISSIFHIRFFTPTVEVPVCGHATLASAHILYSQGMVECGQEIEFKAKIGTLKAKKSHGFVTIDLPLLSYQKRDASEWKINPFNKSISEFYTADLGWNIIVMKNEEDVNNTSPDFALMISENISHTIITAKSDSESEYDFVVRCFAPNKGINEDPVTGSVQCFLAPLWAEKLSERVLKAKQLSERSGMLYAEIVNDRVLVSGATKTVFKIEIV